MNPQISDISVRVFMRCLFSKDYTDVPNWDEIYTQYIDLSGLSKEGHLGLLIAKHNLEVRLKHITDWLELQQKVFKLIGKPHLPALDDLFKYAHRVTWNPDEPQKFADKLLQIDGYEKRNYVELKLIKKEIDNLEKVQNHKTVNARNEFVIMLNVLRKNGNQIDKDKTDMEELSLMIKLHREEAAALKK